MATVYRDSKYFKVGESYKNPLSNRLIKVGGRTFNKLYVEFGDDALYKHMVENEPQERIVEAIRNKPQGLDLQGLSCQGLARPEPSQKHSLIC
jgi:hypothetical protein